MAYDSPYIEKKHTQNIDTSASLYILAEVIFYCRGYILQFYEVQPWLMLLLTDN